MFCSRCGDALPTGGNFCPGCGTTVAGGQAVIASPVAGTPQRPWLPMIAWAIVIASLLFPLWFPKGTLVAIPLLWIGFTIVLPGKSTMARVGKGLIAAFVVMVAILAIQQRLLGRQ